MRPFDGTTLFAAGQEAALAGDPNGAVEYWQASYKLGSHHQHRLLRLLTRQWPANILLEIFPSDVDSLPIVVHYYEENGREEDVQIALEQFALAAANRAGAEQGSLAAEYWMRAGDAYLRLANLARASQCLHSAVRSDPSCIHAHRMLGALLIRLQEFDEAEEHVTWCLQRDPDNKYLRSLLEQAVDGQLRPRATSAQRGRRPVVN